jgi:hypothetical protein
MIDLHSKTQPAPLQEKRRTLAEADPCRRVMKLGLVRFQRASSASAAE